MPVTVIVGGQYGSEGKGKVALDVARRTGATVAVRVGGSNAGHTAYDEDGVRHVFRHLPTPVLLPETVCVLGPGSLIDPEVLRCEAEDLALSTDRLIIDPLASVITKTCKQRECDSGLGERIGSTLTGSGEALIDRVRRSATARLARSDPHLARFTRTPVRDFLRQRLQAGERVVIEGTQGFGLSNLQSPHYPFATSRDTTASAFASEAAISPLDVDEIVLVIRTFPIRVGGNSGPLPRETTWNELARRASKPGLVERTTVTDRPRRVAEFDPEIVRSAIAANAPTSVVLNHVDYLGVGWAKSIERIEALIGRRVDWLGVSPHELILRGTASAEQGIGL